MAVPRHHCYTWAKVTEPFSAKLCKKWISGWVRQNLNSCISKAEFLSLLFHFSHSPARSHTFSLSAFRGTHTLSPSLTNAHTHAHPHPLVHFFPISKVISDLNQHLWMKKKWPRYTRWPKWKYQLDKKCRFQFRNGSRHRGRRELNAESLFGFHFGFVWRLRRQHQRRRRQRWQKHQHNNKRYNNNDNNIDNDNNNSNDNNNNNTDNNINNNQYNNSCETFRFFPDPFKFDVCLFGKTKVEQLQCLIE